jgi:hypothetical protein
MTLFHVFLCAVTGEWIPCPPPIFCPRPGEIPLRAFIRPVFNRNGTETHLGGGTPVRAITLVPEPLNGRADEASPRDPPRWGADRKNFPLCANALSEIFLSMGEKTGGGQGVDTY